MKLAEHIDTGNGDHGSGLDPKRMIALNYSNVHKGAYLEASDAVRAVIDQMTIIINTPGVSEEDREAAIDTLTDALFPLMHKGQLGMEVEEVKVVPKDGTSVESVKSDMALEEASFATRLASAMERQGIDQSALAEKTGVGQPAISMMLARECRPQRRTVQKFAAALGVDPSELWPGMK